MFGWMSSRRANPAAAGTTRRARLALLSATAALAGCLAMTSGAFADGTVTLPGGPLVVSVGSLGECQSNYPNTGNNFYPGDGTLGDCGFFLSFPTTNSAEKLKGKVFGFFGTAGPHLEAGELLTAVEQAPVTGSGSSGDPYTEVTKFKVTAEEKDYALITDTTKYVNGDAQFTSTYTVENVTGKSGETVPGKGGTPFPTEQTLFFHAIAAGDLFVANDDVGTGVFLGGPPKFIGGQNPNTGTLGGFIEATPAWTNYQEGEWDKVIWEAVRTSPGAAGGVFNDTIDPSLLDNGAGVSWDEHLASPNGLKKGETATYSIISRSQVPTSLGVQPVSQTHAVGQTATVTVTAKDNVGTPYGGRSLVYSIGGANPKSGSVTTNSSGEATISYVGTAAGLDTMQMYLDLNGDGSHGSGEPTSAAQITWTPVPPTPPSPTGGYRVQSIHANTDGTITIVFVPLQDGTATVEVTVPTATISRSEAIAAKRKKCKRSEVKIRGRCRPRTTVSGKITASGKAGVALKLTVKPSIKVKRALKRGRKVQLTAKLTYTSKLGGKPVTQTFQVTVKPPKKKKH